MAHRGEGSARGHSITARHTGNVLEVRSASVRGRRYIASGKVALWSATLVHTAASVGPPRTVPLQIGLRDELSAGLQYATNAKEEYDCPCTSDQTDTMRTTK